MHAQAHGSRAVLGVPVVMQLSCGSGASQAARFRRPVSLQGARFKPQNTALAHPVRNRCSVLVAL